MILRSSGLLVGVLGGRIDARDEASTIGIHRELMVGGIKYLSKLCSRSSPVEQQIDGVESEPFIVLQSVEKVDAGVVDIVSADPDPALQPEAPQGVSRVESIDVENGFFNPIRDCSSQKRGNSLHWVKRLAQTHSLSERNPIITSCHIGIVPSEGTSE